MGSIFVLEDTWHYWFHRGLHYGVFYKYIHKQHHRYAAPFGLAAEYAHPVEVALLGLGTVGIPIVWCLITGNLHLFTVSIWIILRLFQAVDAHSGYEFPWSLHNFLPFWLVLIIMMNIIIISLVDTLHLLDGGISFWIPKLVQKLKG